MKSLVRIYQNGVFMGNLFFSGGFSSGVIGNDAFGEVKRPEVFPQSLLSRDHHRRSWQIGRSPFFDSFSELDLSGALG